MPSGSQIAQDIPAFQKPTGNAAVKFGSQSAFSRPSLASCQLTSGT